MTTTPQSDNAPRSLLRVDLIAIAERFDRADQLARRAQTQADREAAEALRRDAAGQLWASQLDLADLFLLLLRQALQHRRAALASYLTEALQDELEPIAATVARLEDQRCPS